MKKILTVLGLTTMLVACSSSKPVKVKEIGSNTTVTRPVIKDYEKIKISGYDVDSSMQSLAQNERVQFIVLHYTAGSNEASLKELLSNRVSAHFLLLDDDSDDIYNIVPLDKRAWHAGASTFRGKSNLNDISVGIEIVNDGIARQYRNYPTYHPYDHYVDFNENQIEKVVEILKFLIERYNIPARNIVAHSDIAPGRKLDPGAKFPWKMLYEKYNIGAWYDEADKQKFMDQEKFATLSPKQIKAEFKKYGYNVNETNEWDKEGKDVVYAFQLHFNPKNPTGVMDLETYAILKALNKKYTK